MKKLARLAAVFAALAMMGTGFIACSDDDDDNNNTQNPTPSTGGTETPGGTTQETTTPTSETTTVDTTAAGTFEEDITKLDVNQFTSLKNNETDSNKNPKYQIENGTTFGNGYFKVVQSTNSATSIYATKAKDAVLAIELDKQSNKSWIEFTVTGKATVTFVATSTGDKNTTYAGIVASNAELTKEAATAISGKTATDIGGTELSAGTYKLVVYTDNTDKSLARVTSMKAEQTAN